MNLEDSEDWWNTSEIQNTSFKFDDEEDTVSSKNNTNDDNQSLLDLVSGVTLSGKSDIKHPSIDMYSLVSKKSVDYILNGSTTQEYYFSPYKDKVVNQSSIDISNVVSNMCCGQDECLESFKTFSSKQQLLTCAIDKKNNNVILRVICFLAKSLKPVLMNEIFLREPKAFDLYVNFLISKGDMSKSLELLDILGCNRDAGILHLTNCLSNKSDPIVSMKYISNSYFLMDSDKIHINNYIKLLEWQKNYAQEFAKEKVYQFTAAKCLEYVMHKPELELTENICKNLNIDENLHHWILLKEKSSIKQWSVISDCFLSKKWYGRLSVSTSIPVEDIIRIMAINMAPESELKKYLETISDVSARLSLAKKYKCFHTVVDILVDQKDKQALLSFKSEQPVQSKSYFYAENALRSHSVKWKN